MREREVYNRQTEREKTVVIVGTRILESFDWKVKFLADKKSILSLSFLVQQAAQVYSRGLSTPSSLLSPKNPVDDLIKQCDQMAK